MEYRQLTENFSVSPQIAPEDVGAVKAAGFKSVICNRPDGEQPGQPEAESVRQAVEEAGLTFRYIPVVSGQVTPENVAEMAEALDDLEGPVFAYCRSGTRCANLFMLVQENEE